MRLLSTMMLVLSPGLHPAQAETVLPNFHTFLSGGAGVHCWLGNDESDQAIPDISIQDKKKKLVKKYALATSCTLVNHPEAVASTSGTLTMGRIAAASSASAPGEQADAGVNAMFQDAVWPAAPGKVQGDTITYTAQLDVGASLDGFDPTNPDYSCAFLQVGLGLWSPDGVNDSAVFTPVSPFHGRQSLMVHVAKVINGEPLLLTVNTQMWSLAYGAGACTAALASLTKELRVHLSADVSGANTVSVNGVDYR